MQVAFGWGCRKSRIISDYGFYKHTALIGLREEGLLYFYKHTALSGTRGKIYTLLKLNVHETRIVQTLVETYGVSYGTRRVPTTFNTAVWTT